MLPHKCRVKGTYVAPCVDLGCEVRLSFLLIDVLTREADAKGEEIS